MPLSEGDDHRRDFATPTPGPAPAEKETVIDKVKRAAKTGQLIRIDGMTVDGITAQTVVDAYGKLTGKRREKFASLPIKKMVCKAFEIAERG